MKSSAAKGAAPRSPLHSPSGAREPVRNRTILLADDDDSLRRITEHNLSQHGYTVLAAKDGEEALRLFKQHAVHLTVADLKMPGLDGLELLREIRRLDKAAIVVMITAHGSIETAVQAMRDGAYDYIAKPFDRDDLQKVVQKALQWKSANDQIQDLRQQLARHVSLPNIVGACALMQKLFDQVARIAQTDSTVFIQGESGTGKELIARTIHFASPRADKPFIIVNCATLPEDIMESELFGHVKGAFTDAKTDKLGKFEAADEGSIFLDEVVELRPELQVKLLRVLQEKTVDKVGATTPIPVDVRVIAATNRDLDLALKSGKLREDLYYRLSVIPLRLPPLRERKDDIPALVQHFLIERNAPQCRVAPEVLDAFQRYDWPGNVRELENLIERTLVLRAKPDVITLDDIPEHIKSSRVPDTLQLGIPDKGISFDEVERKLLTLALQKAEGNQTRAAELLGMTRQTLLYRAQKHGLL
ncbi:MAG: sigma-54-dependent Fis family transcriptional regulator [Planctomycetes bacterium]|nr:sigma-54-dependent Fis family transcriptional regulator [Planctomycetota bacterium]MBM4080657.1 sigma-54-dependent Fis family transcriptional regulator [Planctomycetota bacterium]